jgi:hypothetical protein
VKLSNQFDRLAAAINEDGGFSHKVAGPGAGTDAKHAYMVGQGGHDFPPGDVSAGQLRDFSIENYDRLTPPDIYLGGWQGSEPTRGAVEPSKAYPRFTRGASSRAKLDAATTNQQAVGVIYDDYVGQLNNPNYVEGAGHARHKPTKRDVEWAFPQRMGPRPTRNPSSKQTTIPRH